MRPSGRARISATSPEALAICDRCGFQFNLVDLRYQHQWAGNKLQNLHLRVCERCLDRPQPQLMAHSIAPDPEPVYDPRPGAIPIDL